MSRLFAALLFSVAVAALALSGCAQAGPAPAPTGASPLPTKGSQPAQSTQPTQAPKVSYPEKGKAVTFIVPFAAGGSTDIGARILASMLEKELGVPVQVVNKGGAGSQVGVTELAKSKPDGYTIGMVNLPSSITPYLDPDRGAAYSRKDLVPVANHVGDVNMVGVPSSSPYKTLKDLIDDARANPEKIRVGTTGFLAETHLAVLMLQQAAGVKLTAINFNGSAEANPALLGGHVEAVNQGAANYIPMVKSGDVRLLAALDTQPVKFFPDVPTAESQGYKVVMVSNRGVCVPAGTPKEIVDILGKAMEKIANNEEHNKKIEEMGLLPRYMNAAEYAATWDEVEKVTKPALDQAKREAASK